MTTPPVLKRWVPPGLRKLLDAHPDQREIVEEAYWAGVRHGRPFIATSPEMRGGQPTVNNTRLTVEAVAGLLWAGESVETVAAEYEITRHDVLVAAWHAGTYGLPGTRRRGLAATRRWRERWGRWASEAHDALWATQTGPGIDGIPDPPSETEWQR